MFEAIGSRTNNQPLRSLSEERGNKQGPVAAFIASCATPGMPRMSEAKKWATHAQGTQLNSHNSWGSPGSKGKPVWAGFCCTTGQVRFVFGGRTQQTVFYQPKQLFDKLLSLEKLGLWEDAH